MKTIYITWTYLDTIEVPDDMTADEIEELLDDMEPRNNTYDDREWSYKV